MRPRRLNYRLNPQFKEKFANVPDAEDTTSALRTKTAQLVMAALSDFSKQGATLNKIMDHIINEFDVPEDDFKKFVPGVLRRGLLFGSIKEANGKYRIGHVLNQLSQQAIKRICHSDHHRDKPDTSKRLHRKLKIKMKRKY